MSKMNKQRRIFFYVSLLINVIFILQAFASLEGWNLYNFFNSDGLYLASIYKDIFIDKTGLEGWYLNASPNFFPEWPVYFLIRFISGDFRLAALIYAIFCVVSVNIMTAIILKIVFKGINYTYLTLVNLGYTMLLMIYLYHADFSNILYLITSGYHLGVFIMSLLSFIFFFAYLKKGRTLYAIILFIIVLLGVLSDRLLIMHFVIPSLFAFLFLNNKELRPRIIISGILEIFAAFGGMWLYSELKSSDVIYIIDLGYKSTNFSNTLTSLGEYFTILGTFWNSGGFKLLVLVLTVFSFIAGGLLVLGFLLNKNNRLVKNTLEKILITSFTSYIFFVAFTPVANGTFMGLAHLRFNYYAFCIGISLFIVIIYLFSRQSDRRIRIADWITLFFLGFAIFGIIKIESGHSTVKGLHDFASYYPENVEKIDQAVREHGLKFGVAHYWQAKHTTMFSKEDVRIYTVVSNISPWFHVTNKNWYFRDGRGKYGDPAFNFILLDDLKPDGAFYDSISKVSDTIYLDGFIILHTPEFAFQENPRKPYIVNEKK